MITIRKASIEDTDALSDFMLQLDNECDYLLHHPGERGENVELTKKFLLRIAKNERSAIFLAENSSEGIIGYVCGEALLHQRIAHVMKVSIGMLKKYQKKGIGRMLAYALHDHANKVGIYRAEAAVIKENKLSLNLSKRMGFELEGIKKHAFKIGDHYYDECLLVKFIFSKYNLAADGSKP